MTLISAPVSIKTGILQGLFLLYQIFCNVTVTLSNFNLSRHPEIYALTVDIFSYDTSDLWLESQ